MAKYDLPRLTDTYAAAQRIVDAGLRSDDSLFTPGKPIWSIGNFEELDRLYVQAPDAGEGSFEEKLKQQIGNGSPAAIQLMAEIHFPYYLPARGAGGDLKRERIREILSWAGGSVVIPDELDKVLDQGIGGGGVGFHTYKWASVSYLVRFGLAWKGLPAQDREGALADPWLFKAIADGVPTLGGGTFGHEALIHLVHPEAFERIFSRGEKWNLTERLKAIAGDAEDVDRRLTHVRSVLETRFGKPMDFYDTVPVMAMWKPEQNPWATFLYWASRFKDLPDFEQDERGYKLEVAELLAPARDAVRGGGDDWLELLGKALRSRQNNLTDWREHDRFLKWAEGNHVEARSCVLALWEDPSADPLACLSAFIDRLPKDIVTTPGNRVNLASVLLMAVDPYRLPPYRPTPFQLAYELTDFGTPEAAEVGRYRQALTFLDQILDRAASQGLELRDRLDAQSAMWAVATSEPPAEWEQVDRDAFVRYRGARGVAEEEEASYEDDSVLLVSAAGTDKLAPLADELLLDPQHLAEIVEVLMAKRQIVFYGPPGTGKTFVARKLAAAVAENPERVRLVQFHPAYAYEDFVEGYRPREVNGQPGFKLEPGPLKRLAQQAALEPSAKHVLVIDEMNRGNVPKVLGELYFLLEYRNEKMQLLYSGEPFEFPGNVLIIGTMNTADRSIALLDAALRRRFAFIPFFPDRPPIEGLLRRWLGRNRPQMGWVADVVDRANVLLSDRNGAIGPSFFMKGDLDEGQLKRIWAHEIVPYLEDHFFDDPQRLEQFSLEALRSAPTGGSAQEGHERTDRIEEAGGTN